MSQNETSSNCVEIKVHSGHIFKYMEDVNTSCTHSEFQ